MTSGRGGARPGAGRKAKATRYAEQIAAVNDLIAAGLPENVAQLQLLANGGWEQVDEEWVPAGTVTIGSGEALTLVYPDKPADELVLVKRRVSIAAPDRAANQYMINRILGQPAQHVDLDADPDGTLETTAEALSTAARELAAWRKQMTDNLSSLPSAPPTLPISATST